MYTTMNNMRESDSQKWSCEIMLNKFTGTILCTDICRATVKSGMITTLE